MTDDPNVNASDADLTRSIETQSGGTGRMIGRYELLDKIGEGGMGEVWIAKQSEPVKRKVALKLIKQGMDSRSVIARFDQERQALAVMDHPNIAKVLDGGLAENGQPYFVMELVSGKPLVSFCDEAKLSIRDRLELFIPICQAVQHAHQKGVVHRDLKPTNILVTLVDGKPVPKVIDFGLAKAVTGKLTDDTLSTHIGAVLGTLEYMAPEQAGVTADDVDTRADIYSLGVILYELLTGLRPFDLRRAAIDEMIRVIREVDPPSLASRLSTAESLPSTAASRQTEPSRLVSAIRGELDWIAQRCLEKDRNRRYETASGLARDIQRFLADEPIEARPVSSGYRLKKFVARNKGPVVAAVLLFLALAGGVAGTTWGMIEARAAERREAERAEGERVATIAAEKAAADEARERRFAEAITNFVKDDFLALTSVEGQSRFGGEGLDRNATLYQLLERAARKLKERTNLDPLIEAELCWIVGLNYRGAGEAAKGVPFLSRSHELRRTALGADHEDTLNAANSLAVCLNAAGKHDLALPLLEETLNLRKAKLGPDHPNTLGSMGNLAEGYRDAGMLDRALVLFEETLRLTKDKLGSDHPQTLFNMHRMALVQKDLGNVERALALLEVSLELHRNKLGLDHIDTLVIMNDMAVALTDMGKLDQAVPLLQETLKVTKTKLEQGHPATFACMNNLANGLRCAGKLDQAMPLYEETLRLAKVKLGADHPNTLSSMYSLAGGLRAAGKLNQAIQLYDEALKLLQAKLGTDHTLTLACMNALAVALKESGRLDRALPLYRETVNLLKAKLGSDHPDTLACINNLGAALQSAGKIREILPLIEETVEVSKSKLGPDHPATLTAMNNLALALIAEGKVDQALSLSGEASKLAKAKFGLEHPITLMTMNNLALALREAGNHGAALPLLDETLKLRMSVIGREHPDTLISMNNFAAGLVAAGEHERALPLLQQTLKLQRAMLGSDHPDTLITMNSLAATYWFARQLDKSVPLFAETLRIQEAKQGRQHPNTQLTVANLGVNYKDAGQLKDAIPLLEEANLSAKKYRVLRFVAEPLAEAYEKAGEHAKLSNFLQEGLTDARRSFPAESLDLARVLIVTGTARLRQKNNREAEALLREGVAIRSKTQPQVWATFDAESTLGAALLGQMKYADAKPLLLKGYEGMKQREKSIPAPFRDQLLGDAAQRLVELYTATNKPDEVKKWQAERAKYPAAEKSAAAKKNDEANRNADSKIAPAKSTQ